VLEGLLERVLGVFWRRSLRVLKILIGLIRDLGKRAREVEEEGAGFLRKKVENEGFWEVLGVFWREFLGGFGRGS